MSLGALKMKYWNGQWHNFSAFIDWICVLNVFKNNKDSEMAPSDPGVHINNFEQIQHISKYFQQM